jgi:hypothetical protein
MAIRTVHKVVETDTGLSIAELAVPDHADVVQPDGVDDSRVRVNEVVPEFIEDYSTTAWGPVSKNTVYEIGCVTRVGLDRDESHVSGAGIHAFTEKKDAKKWMQDFEQKT